MNVSKRLKKAWLNASSNVIYYVLQAILSFVVRTIFIRKLGSELLGLDSLLLNVLTMLSIAELGIGSAISYGLYKPLAEKKVKKINAYMSFYKKVYRNIGLIIILVSTIIAFFLPQIAKGCDYQYLYLVYFLYVFNTASLYFISYKEVLILADQKKYKIFKYNCFFNCLIYVLQFVLLLVYPNYIIYILIMILSKLFNRIVVNRFISKYYSNIDFDSKEKLAKSDIESIKKNVSGIFCYKIGDYAINCTDNIIISSLINVSTVGIYTNYLSIMTILKTIIKNIFDSITSSFGNLSTEDNVAAENNVFNIMTFLGFIVSGYVTLCFLNLFNPFVQIWAGEYYVLPLVTVIIICCNFYLMCNQMPLDTVKEAHGFYSKDKYVPIIQAIINVTLSIILGIFYGLNGVLIGTTISYLITVFWNKPYIIYKYILKNECFNYFKNQIKYILTVVISYIITYNLFQYLNFVTNIVNIIIMGIIITIIYLLIVTILYCRRSEYKFIFNTIKGILSKNKKKEV